MNDRADRLSRWVPASGWLDGDGGDQQRRSGVWLMALLLALAAALRFYRLGAEPLWIDEYFTWQQCNPGAGIGFWEQVRDMVQGPLHLVAVWPLAHGRLDEAALRLPSALAGIASVPLVWRLGRDLAGERTGRLAALLWALAPFAVWYGREGRGYAMAVFFALAATVVLLRMIRRGPTLGGAIAYALLIACGALSNFSVWLLLAGHGIGVLASPPPPGGRRWRLWLTAFALAVLVCLPWLLKSFGIHAMGRLAPAAETGPALRGETTFTPLAYPFSFFAFFFGYSLGPSLAELHRPDRIEIVRSWLPLLAPAGAVAGIAVLAGLVRLRGRRTTLLSIWILVPTVLLTVLALRNVKAFNPRYLAVIQPLLLILAAAGLIWLSRLPRRIVGGLLLGFCLFSLGASHLDARYGKEDFRAAAEWVAAQQKSGDLIIVPGQGEVFGLYYRGGERVVGMPPVARDADVGSVRGNLGDAIGTAARCWLLTSSRSVVDPGARYAAELAATGVIVARRDFSGLDVLLWEAGGGGGHVE